MYCQTETCLQNLDHPGYHSISQIISMDTIVREYILHLPTDHNIENSSPLVINLHGFGDCASNFADDVGKFYAFNELADKENFIAAYPQAAYRPLKEDTYWEPGDNGTDNIYENDVYFIEQLISEINNEFNIDLDKIYAIGYSNGGMMVYSLACNRSDLFSAVGIMSGVMLEEDCTLNDPIPIIKFHGIADEVLPYDGSLWYQSVSDVVNFWLDQNNIPVSSQITTELNEGKVVKDEFSENVEGSCFHLYTINEEWDKPGGHVWFSDNIDGLSPNEIVWNFFSNQCSVTSTEEISDIHSSINIFPNPFQNQLTIENKFKNIQQFKVFNILGELQTKGKLNAGINAINLESLPPNVYFLKIGNRIEKLIKTEKN